MLENTDAEQKLVTTSMEVGRFASDWCHCDQLSNFLARAVSLDRPDPFYFANLLSTILNEVFESIFHHHGGSGNIVVDLRRSSGETVLKVEVPVDADSSPFYQTIARNLMGSDLAELYRRYLQDASLDDHAMGFYELASVYEAKIEIISDEPQMILLKIRVKIDDVSPLASAA